MMMDVTATDKDGNTALHLAAASGSLEKLKLLLANNDKASLNTPNAKHCTPLILAIKSGHLECVKSLLATPGIVVPKEKILTHIKEYAENPKQDKLRERIIACLDQTRSARSTVPGEQKSEKTSTSPHTATVRVQSTTGSTVFTIPAKGIIGSTPVRTAIALNRVKFLQQLMTDKQDVHTANHEGITPLMAAASHGHLECLKLLLAQKAVLETINKQDKLGLTALMLAAVPNADNTSTESDPLACVQALIDAGADLNIATSNGITALLVATSYGYLPCVQLLLQQPQTTLPVGEKILLLDGQVGLAKILPCLQAIQNESKRREREAKAAQTTECRDAIVVEIQKGAQAVSTIHTTTQASITDEQKPQTPHQITENIVSVNKPRTDYPVYEHTPGTPLKPDTLYQYFFLPPDKAEPWPLQSRIPPYAKPLIDFLQNALSQNFSATQYQLCVFSPSTAVPLNILIFLYDNPINDDFDLAALEKKLLPPHVFMGTVRRSHDGHFAENGMVSFNSFDPLDQTQCNISLLWNNALTLDAHITLFMYNTQDWRGDRDLLDLEKNLILYFMPHTTPNDTNVPVPASTSTPFQTATANRQIPQNPVQYLN